MSRLCSQTSRALQVSVMANIAEGFVRESNKEFVQFLFIAMSIIGRSYEAHLYIAVDQNISTKDAFESIYAQADKTGRIISELNEVPAHSIKPPINQMNPRVARMAHERVHGHPVGTPFGRGRVTKRSCANSLPIKALSRYCRR